MQCGSGLCIHIRAEDECGGDTWRIVERWLSDLLEEEM